MSPEGDAKSRLERLLEVGVYAPVGFLVTRSKTVPDLAQAGRRQIAFAQSLGRAALKSLARGMRRDEPTGAPARASARSDTQASAAPRAGERIDDAVDSVEAEVVDDVFGAEVMDAEMVPVEMVDDAVTDVVEVTDDESTDPVEAQGAPDSTSHAADSGAIDDYDDLTAREIIELIQSGDARRARWVHDRETAGKGRVTVLRAAAKAFA